MQVSKIKIQGSEKHETYEEQALKTLTCKAYQSRKLRAFLSSIENNAFGRGRQE